MVKKVHTQFNLAILKYPVTCSLNFQGKKKDYINLKHPESSTVLSFCPCIFRSNNQIRRKKKKKKE